MTEDAKAALGILEQAMGIEQEGSQFYLKAAQTTRDKKGQEMKAELLLLMCTGCWLLPNPDCND